ncbi:hypothetical protein C7974DRAFT_80365 [Boeremia exigua]|uniref:uncharacterized protein n=1 Tax=Boeremia exigua TaxID=749465 RepID=UPI001E8D2FD0|nr:uncharacterized protein C7974DRAFT_80365 [Boeremia exigua]KAH6612561.1 hypothetical protein C7974DRAFT_80365 [Boeremia exigua]
MCKLESQNQHTVKERRVQPRLSRPGIPGRARSEMHRRSTLFSNPLSICLNLKSFIRMTEIERVKHRRQLPITSQAALPKGCNQVTSSQKDYTSKVLVEPPTEPSLIADHRFPSLRALTSDAEIGDGLWLCCHCRHENILRHYAGLFPFKHLTCRRCTRIVCSHCHTTEILSPLPFGMVHAPAPAQGREPRYLHVCTACGLSHRAEMVGSTIDFYGVTCQGCGASSYGDWPRFCIGSVEPYRRDPDARYVRLVEQKAERAVCQRCCWDEEDRAVSQLSCRNGDGVACS